MVCFTAFLSASPATSQSEMDYLKNKLNTERIKHFFGNCKIEILQTPFPHRISSQNTVHNGEKFSRAFAIIDFEKCLPAVILKTHQRIKAGSSIGSTLKNEGWSIEKKSLYFGSIEMTDQLNTWMKQDVPEKVEMHIYELNISKGDVSTKYCTIAEMYSPDFLDEQRMKQLHAEYLDKQDLAPSDIFPSLNTILRNIPPPS